MANIEQALTLIYLHLRTLDELREPARGNPACGERAGWLPLIHRRPCWPILRLIPEPLGKMAVRVPALWRGRPVDYPRGYAAFPRHYEEFRGCTCATQPKIYRR